MTRPAALSLYRPLDGARRRIAAFPHAGGGASAFRALGATLVPYGVELCALQPPGRENRVTHPFHRTAEDTAREFAEALASLPPLPTAFLGHSLGGLVAYLTARLGAAHGMAPCRLVVSASRSPLQRRHESTNAATAPPLRERVLALGGVPDAIGRDPELFAIFEPIIQADLDLAKRYEHRAADPLPYPITVYSGAQDEAVPPESATAWQGLTAEPLRRRTFEGGHFFLYEAPAAVAAALLEDVE